MKEKVRCLYCHHEYSLEDARLNGLPDGQCCPDCGMALPDKHPESRFLKMKLFRWVFALICLFCVVMMLYLPR